MSLSSSQEDELLILFRMMFKNIDVSSKWFNIFKVFIKNMCEWFIQDNVDFM
jgi:hypothetical protein